jgi:hypothetical protein
VFVKLPCLTCQIVKPIADTSVSRYLVVHILIIFCGFKFFLVLQFFNYAVKAVQCLITDNMPSFLRFYFSFCNLLVMICLFVSTFHIIVCLDSG